MKILHRLAVFIVVLFVITGTPAAAFAEDEPDQVIKVVSDDWNSLEVTRVIIGLLTPAVMLFIGVWLDQRIKEFEHRQWSNQKVIEKRLEVYEKLTPGLNELMCYFMRIGGWKENDPTEIVGMKRDLDKIAHIYAPLFSAQFLSRYNHFMGLCFATFRGAGKDAQLKTESEYYRDAYVGGDDDDGTWNPGWDDCFAGPEEASERDDIRKGYQELVGLIAKELGVGLGADESPEDTAA